jgi:hypothetical protein
MRKEISSPLEQSGNERRWKHDGREFAECGWIVEVVLTAPDDQPDARFFAVGTERATEAEYAILRYPGILPTDRRTARRRLSANEIAGLGLKAQAVRPMLHAG